MGAPGEEEPRGRRTEHELEHLTPLPAHLQATPLLVHGEHRGRLETPAEVGDARPIAGTGDGS